MHDEAIKDSQRRWREMRKRCREKQVRNHWVPEEKAGRHRQHPCSCFQHLRRPVCPKPNSVRYLISYTFNLKIYI